MTYNENAELYKYVLSVACETGLHDYCHGGCICDCHEMDALILEDAAIDAACDAARSGVEQ